MTENMPHKWIYCHSTGRINVITNFFNHSQPTMLAECFIFLICCFFFFWFRWTNGSVRPHRIKARAGAPKLHFMTGDTFQLITQFGFFSFSIHTERCVRVKRKRDPLSLNYLSWKKSAAVVIVRPFRRNQKWYFSAWTFMAKTTKNQSSPTRKQVLGIVFAQHGNLVGRVDDWTELTEGLRLRATQTISIGR